MLSTIQYLCLCYTEFPHCETNNGVSYLVLTLTFKFNGCYALSLCKPKVTLNVKQRYFFSRHLRPSDVFKGSLFIHIWLSAFLGVLTVLQTQENYTFLSLYKQKHRQQLSFLLDCPAILTRAAKYVLLHKLLQHIISWLRKNTLQSWEKYKPLGQQ